MPSPLPSIRPASTGGCHKGETGLVRFIGLEVYILRVPPPNLVAVVLWASNFRTSLCTACKLKCYTPLGCFVLFSLLRILCSDTGRSCFTGMGAGGSTDTCRVKLSRVVQTSLVPSTMAARMGGVVILCLQHAMGHSICFDKTDILF